MSHSGIHQPQSGTRRRISKDRTAHRCRSLALEFLTGAPCWTKLDLASWLLEYGRVVWTDADRDTPASFRSGPLGESSVRDMILRAHAEVLRVLRSENNPDIGAQVVVHAFVHDLVLDYREGTSVRWAPFSQPGLSLGDRVLSLLAADCLTSRDDYLGGLHVCQDCGRFSLGAERGADPNCDACAWQGERVSQISIREWAGADEDVAIETEPPLRRAAG